MNICVVGSRRSGTTALANAIYSAMRELTHQSVKRQIEPFAWHYVDIDGWAIGERYRIEQDFHLSMPLIAGPEVKSKRLDEVMTFDGINVVKFNLAMGRLPLLGKYPDTVIIHLFRNPIEVINSFQGLGFDLGTVGLGAGQDNDWEQWFDQVAPYYRGCDPIVCNAGRWAIENLIAFSCFDMMISYERLTTNSGSVADDLLYVLSRHSLTTKNAYVMHQLFEGFKKSGKEINLGSYVNTIKQIAYPAYHSLLRKEGTWTSTHIRPKI